MTNFTAANSCFSNAVALSPTNETGNVFYAATRLLVLPYQQPGSNFLTRLGIPTAGRDIYNWTARPPTDTNGVPLTAPGVGGVDVVAMLRTNVLPELIAAEANLATVTDTNFLLNLSSQDTGIIAVQIDFGDVILVRAMLEAAAYFSYTINCWNVDAQFDALRSLYLDGEFNPGQILDHYPQLFTFSSTNDLAAAKAAFSSAVGLYLQASAFIRARPLNESRLFNYDFTVADKEAKFRSVLADLNSALEGAVRLQVNSQYTVNLQPLFDGLHPLRSFLPGFSDNNFVLGTFDPTFQGVLSGLDLTTPETFIAKYFPPVPDFASETGIVQNQFLVQLNVLPGRGYAIESSTDLRNWTLVLHQLATNTVITFADPDVRESRRFYRAREESNDRFNQAYIIAGFPATVLGSNQGATSEPGDPTNYFNQVFGTGSPVWWTWTAPASGLVGISAAGSSFSPAIGVFTGSALANLVAVQNLATNSPYTGEFDFQAVAGTTYLIAVESAYYFQQGTFTLALAGPPQNDNFASSQLLTGSSAAASGWNVLATAEANEISYGGHSVWYSWMAPSSRSSRNLHQTAHTPQEPALRLAPNLPRAFFSEVGLGPRSRML
jgi:hypothetical protein